MEDKDKEPVDSEAATIAARMIRTRKELETHAEDLREIYQDLQLSMVDENPVPLSLLQVNGILSNLTTLKTQADIAQVHLIRYETDKELSKQDSSVRKKFLKLCNKAFTLATSLKCTKEASQQLHLVS